jgi:hypothetical protein
MIESNIQKINSIKMTIFLDSIFDKANVFFTEQNIFVVVQKNIELLFFILLVLLGLISIEIYKKN